ncbi:MAG TPA: hypothetical protein VNK48_14585 [Xanthobacteraceae bacterium]|nr:hypothetical protein [Xanthobacteraceae bacterium]
MSQNAKRGRPPKGEEAMYARINIRVPRAMMAEIERLANERMDRPDKADIVRMLLAEAIRARRLGG